MVETISQNVFEEKVLKSEKPVLVDFMADWCPDCRKMNPILDETAEEKADEVTCYRVNIDNDKPLAQSYGVKGIPNMLLFKKGEPVASIFDSMPKEEFVRQLEAGLAK